MSLFHDVEPIHKHGQCKNCGRQRRVCLDSSSRRRQSKECQKDHWRTGHRDLCKLLRTHSRDVAIALSGNPNAWNGLRRLGRAPPHHTSLVNVALACYLHNMKPHAADVTSKRLLVVPLPEYLDDPRLPAEKQFRMAGALLPDKDDPRSSLPTARPYSESPSAPSSSL